MSFQEVDLALLPVVGLVGDAEKSPQALGLESLGPFLGVSKQRPFLIAIEEDVDDNKLVIAELVARLVVLLRYTAITDAIQTRISAAQMSSLHRVAPMYLKLVTASNFRPYMLAYALMSFVLLVITLLFSLLTSIPCALALPKNLSLTS